MDCKVSYIPLRDTLVVKVIVNMLIEKLSNVKNRKIHKVQVVL